MGPLWSRWCWGRQEAATLAGASKGAVTSFRWSVLLQDAERLCVQEMARSPSSSCQDRGVCRERNPVRQLSSSNEPCGSRHTIFRTEVVALGGLLSPARRPPGCCQPDLPSPAPPRENFPIFSPHPAQSSRSSKAENRPLLLPLRRRQASSGAMSKL